MEYQKIAWQVQGRVGILSFNSPEVLNAISRPVLVEMADVLTRISQPDAGVRCLLLTGTGRGFSAGANLQAGGVVDSGGGADIHDQPAGNALETDYMPVLNQIRNLPFPMVTAVNGVAAGVGMSFALMGDLVIAARSAYFLQAFAKIGLVPDGGATWLLPRLIGWARAVELSMLAERLSADQALEWGLINRVVDDEQLQDQALSYAERLANGPASLGLMRKAYWSSFNNSYMEQMQLESDLQRQAGATEDSREGVLAFLEKREAHFVGR